MKIMLCRGLYSILVEYWFGIMCFIFVVVSTYLHNIMIATINNIISIKNIHLHLHLCVAI